MDISSNFKQFLDRPITPVRISGGVALDETERLLSPSRNFGPIGSRRTGNNQLEFHVPSTGPISSCVADSYNMGGKVKIVKLRGPEVVPCIPIQSPIGSAKEVKVATGVYGGEFLSTFGSPLLSQQGIWGHSSGSFFNSNEQNLLKPTAAEQERTNFARQNFSQAKNKYSKVATPSCSSAVFKNDISHRTAFQSTIPMESRPIEWNLFQPTEPYRFISDEKSKLRTPAIDSISQFAHDAIVNVNVNPNGSSLFNKKYNPHTPNHNTYVHPHLREINPKIQAYMDDFTERYGIGIVGRPRITHFYQSPRSGKYFKKFEDNEDNNN